MADFHAQRLGADVIEGYILVKENWKYDELRPTMMEIKEAYVKAHGRNYEEDDMDMTQESAKAVTDLTAPDNSSSSPVMPL